MDRIDVSIANTTVRHGANGGPVYIHFTQIHRDIPLSTSVLHVVREPILWSLGIWESGLFEWLCLGAQPQTYLTTNPYPSARLYYVRRRSTDIKYD